MTPFSHRKAPPGELWIDPLIPTICPASLMSMPRRMPKMVGSLTSVIRSTRPPAGVHSHATISGVLDVPLFPTTSPCSLMPYPPLRKGPGYSTSGMRPLASS